ncbi:phage integrase N-terminal SAM-like domain-containing protein [Ramlibacter sp.]|uniref:phage integrase N-terminal SAM-like domain-containing protein n=1 Tax=Ramlibacter sp. TaxID=1917967 RepID=UPI003D1488F8
MAWVRVFARLQGLRHPRELGAAEGEAFLTHLAQDRNVSAFTHRQTLSASFFLCREVLRIDLPWLAETGRPRRGDSRTSR